MQNYANFEIVIGDDASTDGDVSAYIQTFGDGRIKYFCNERNLGMIDNFHTMLYEYATGDYAVMLNADDYWIDGEFISKAMKIFQYNKEVVLVFGDVKVHAVSLGKFSEDRMHKHLPQVIDGNQFFMDYPKGYSFPHLACVYDRTLALDLDFYTNRVISEDWESFLKLIQGNKVGYISDTVGVLTKHAHNFTKTTSLELLFQADSYIHHVYRFAAARQCFEEKELKRWLFLMLKRHHVKWLIKLWFLDKEKLPAYKNFLHTTYSKLYQNIQRDHRYRGYLWIRRFPFLLKWVFRYVLKQESFILDLLAYRSILPSNRTKH